MCTPDLIHNSLGSPHSLLVQTAARLVQPFLHGRFHIGLSGLYLRYTIPLKIPLMCGSRDKIWTPPLSNTPFLWSILPTTPKRHLDRLSHFSTVRASYRRTDGLYRPTDTQNDDGSRPVRIGYYAIYLTERRGLIVTIKHLCYCSKTEVVKNNIMTISGGRPIWRMLLLLLITMH